MRIRGVLYAIDTYILVYPMLILCISAASGLLYMVEYSGLLFVIPLRLV